MAHHHLIGMHGASILWRSLAVGFGAFLLAGANAARAAAIDEKAFTGRAGEAVIGDEPLRTAPDASVYRWDGGITVPFERPETNTAPLLPSEVEISPPREEAESNGPFRPLEGEVRDIPPEAAEPGR